MKQSKRQSRRGRPQADPEKIFQSLERLGLTEADMLLLEREIEPVKGAPFELGWPHYRALLDVREDAERFWYQEKSQNQALTLRELEKCLRENLFYKILGRRPPKPPALGPRRPAPKMLSKAEAENDPAYQKLLSDITKIVEETEAKGIAVRHCREEILACSACGAFEDVLCGEEKRRTFLASGEETGKPFLVIDTRNLNEYRAHGTRHVTKYRYVCGVCGLHQSASSVSVFYDEEERA